MIQNGICSLNKVGTEVTYITETSNKMKSSFRATAEMMCNANRD